MSRIVRRGNRVGDGSLYRPISRKAQWELCATLPVSERRMEEARLQHLDDVDAGAIPSAIARRNPDSYSGARDGVSEDQPYEYHE